MILAETIPDFAAEEPPFAVTAEAATVNATTIATVHTVTPQQGLSDDEFMVPQRKNATRRSQGPIQRETLNELLKSGQWEI